MKRPASAPWIPSSTTSASAGAAPASWMRRSSAATARADSGRSSGSFASSRSTKASRSRPTSGLCQEGFTGSVLMCWEITATASSPRKGVRPASIS